MKHFCAKVTQASRMHTTTKTYICHMEQERTTVEAEPLEAVTVYIPQDDAETLQEYAKRVGVSKELILGQFVGEWVQLARKMLGKDKKQ